MKKKITYLSPFFPKRLRKFVKERIRKKEIKAYSGNNVICPICKSEFRVFATYGVAQRTNARCLNCNSLERHRLLWMYLKDKTNLLSGDQIQMLHFAPQRKFLSLLSANPNIDYTAADLNPRTYEYYDITKIVKADVMEIPFEKETFDVVMCNHVLEHVTDDRKAMSELFRVMKKGGWGIFQVPQDYNREITFEDQSITDPNEREKVFGQWDHLRVFGRDYKDKLENVGFKVTEDNYIENFSAEEIRKFGLLEGERIYYCEKL